MTARRFATYEECRKTAADYLQKKERVKHYPIYGSTDFEMLEEPDEIEFVNWTYDEVVRIKQLLVKVHNEIFTDEEPITSYKDADLHEIFQVVMYSEDDNNELMDLFYCRSVHHFLPQKVDFDTPCYLYHFAARAYDESRGETLSPFDFYVHLSDDEYTNLLAKRLLMGRNFTFNELCKMYPEIANKITSTMEKSSSNHAYFRMPYLIEMVELREDAVNISGPVEVFYLFENTTPNVNACTEGHELTIYQHPDPSKMPARPKCITTSAEEVSRVLGKPSYYKALEELDSRVGRETCFDDIKAFLKENGINFTEKNV